jgi:hypothetical protein
MKGDEVLISDSIYFMDGRFGYARKVFSPDKKFLGRIDNDYFYKKVNPYLEKATL